MTPTAAPRRILSGVQPSGKLHIGNYFGAIKQHIALQNEAQCFYFIADYHALTTIEEATERRLGDQQNHAERPGRRRYANTRSMWPSIIWPWASIPTRPSSSASPTCPK